MCVCVCVKYYTIIKTFTLRLMTLFVDFGSKRRPQPRGDESESDQYDDDISLFHKDREKVVTNIHMAVSVFDSIFGGFSLYKKQML